MVASNARKNFGFLHISFYKVVQIVLPIIVGYYIIEWFNSFYLRKEVVETTIPQECKSTGKFEADLLALFNE